jgi:broad specificity phosphatase PhoE
MKRHGMMAAHECIAGTSADHLLCRRGRNEDRKPMTETRWWWIRHAPVPDGGRIYGQRDLDCDCSDSVAFNALAHELPRDAVWVTSNLGRTHQTATAIVAASGRKKQDVEMLALPDLAEQHLGDWQGLERKSFFAERGTSKSPFWLCGATDRPPNGETFAELTDRVHGAIHSLEEKVRGRDVIAVTHGGTIRAVLGLALNLDPEASLAFVVDNCSITRVDHLAGEQRRWRVVTVNHRPWIRAAGDARVTGAPQGQVQA